MDYVDKLTALRVDHDISQGEIAELLGCQQSSVSKFETRRARYSIDDLVKLCYFYRVSADDLLGLPRSFSSPEDKNNL